MARKEPTRDTAAERGAHSTEATELDDERTLRLREEQMRATKTPVQTGEVEVRKEVVAEQQTIDVPVTREEVVIERRPVDPATAGRMDAGQIADGETIRVPVREEQVDVEKRAVVTEEVEIGKRAVQETQRVAGTVRREEVVVDHDDTVDVDHRQGNIPHGSDRRHS